MHGRDEKCIQIWLENLKGIGHLEDLDTDGRLILNGILKQCGRMLAGFI
jgi:hypothetical protein